MFLTNPVKNKSCCAVLCCLSSKWKSRCCNVLLTYRTISGEFRDEKGLVTRNEEKKEQQLKVKKEKKEMCERP